MKIASIVSTSRLPIEPEASSIARCGTSRTSALDSGSRNPSEARARYFPRSSEIVVGLPGGDPRLPEEGDVLIRLEAGALPDATRELGLQREHDDHLPESPFRADDRDDLGHSSRGRAPDPQPSRPLDPNVRHPGDEPGNLLAIPLRQGAL